jgi:hypothetical protein
MADDHISIIPATFGMFHTEELAPSALSISQQELATVESKGHELSDWPMDLAMVGSFPSIEFLYQSTKEAEDKASVRVFNGNPELLTLYNAAQGPLESANIASHPSSRGAIETSSSTLTGYLSSTEEPLEEVIVKQEVEVVTENKKLEIHIYGSIGNTFSARNVPVSLSDWWVGNILRSALAGVERGKMWPCDFNSKGYIRASRTPQGRAYKQLGGNDQKWYYVVVYYRYQLHGEAGLTAWRRASPSTTSTKKTFKCGDIAKLQNNDWIPDAAGPDQRKIKKGGRRVLRIEAKDEDNTSLDTARKRSKRGGENPEFQSGSSGSTFSEERPWKKAKGI